MKILIVLLGGIGTQAVEVVLQPAEDAAPILAVPELYRVMTAVQTSQKNTEILVAVYIVSSGIELFSKIEFRRSSSPPAQYEHMSAPDQYSVRIRAKIGRRPALPRL